MIRFPVPDFSKLSRRERLLAAGCVLVLSVVALDRLVLGPWRQHTQKVLQEIRRLEQAIEHHQQLLSRQPQILAETETYRGPLNLEQQGALDMAALLREVEALASQSGVTLGEVKPLAGAVGASTPGSFIEVRFQGSLEQWAHFVYLLETSPILLEIERATVARTPEDFAVLEGSLRLTGQALRGTPPT